MSDEAKTYVFIIALLGLGIMIATLFIFAVSAVYAKYNVWSSSLSGEAELAQADYNRLIAVREAQAKFEAAKSLAQAEIERAKGVAEANRIIADSLKNNEAYLRYLWIDGLKETKGQVIYVPTEANLPILEATRK